MGLIYMLMKWCEVGMIMHTIKWMDIIGNLPIKLGLPYYGIGNLPIELGLPIFLNICN